MWLAPVQVVCMGEEVVCAKWLSAPPCWVWKPSEGIQPVARGESGWKAHLANSLNGRYFEGMNVVDGKMSWLRPGKLFIGLVTVDGQFVVRCTSEASWFSHSTYHVN